MKSRILIANRRLFVALVTFFFSSLLVGNDQDRIRNFDEVEMAAYAADADFSYMNMTIEPPSIWQRIKWWFGDLIARLFRNPNTPWLAEALFYALLILVLGVAIYYIIRLRYGGGISSRSRTFAAANSNLAIGSEQLDYDGLIETAVHEKQFKLAIRYLFLKTLTFLHSKEVIVFRDWKSPYDYEKELDKNVGLHYRSLATLFEHAWYGEFDVSNNEFSEGKKLAVAIEEELK